MQGKIIFWKIMKLFNLNTTFRRNLKTLRYVGKFFIGYSRMTKFDFFEAVRLEGYNEETHKYIVRKVINKDQVIEVEPEKLFLNAYR